MALHQGAFGQRSASYQDLVRALLVVAAVIVLMLVATAILGVQTTAASYEIVPDPAGIALPF